MAEFTIDGVEYRSGKMGGKKQVHVVRRMGPMVDPLFQLMGSGASNEAAVSAFARALGELKDEDVDYVIDNCMRVVQRRQGEAWAQVLASDGKTLMFKDMDDASVILQIIVPVLRDNYEELFLKAPAALSAGGKSST